MPTTAQIRAEDLRTVLFAAKLRQRTNGRTTRLCVLDRYETLPVDCTSTAGWREMAARFAPARSFITPMQRGHVSRLFDRVALLQGRDEVRRTWRTGIRALRAEPRHSLTGCSQ